MSKTKIPLKDKVKALKAKATKSKSPEVKEKPLLNKDLYRIHVGLGSCQSFKGRKFSYMLAENARLIEFEKEKLEKSVEKELTKENQAKLKEYREKLSDLRDEHKFIPGNDDPEDYKKAEEKLTEKYKECLDCFDDSRKEMFEDEAKIKLSVINIKDTPEEITGGLMADIFECISNE